MKKLLTIFAFTTASLATNLTADDAEMQLMWSTWKEAHSKSYDESEEPFRLQIFAENFNTILAHNAAKNSTVTLGLNKFSDLSAHEFKSQYRNGHIPKPDASGDKQEVDEDKRFLSSIPASFDWRSKGAVTSIKNQKSCDGCWSFSAAAALEALHFIKTGDLVNFSEQQLIDCDKTSHGCSSGHMSTALTYTAEYGIELASEYPFVDKTSSCKYSSSKAYKVNKGYSKVSSNNPSALMEAIVKQPVQVAIESTQSIFQHYKSGVITSGCGSATNHAVLAVGYTTVNGVKAFIVKNSWGADWGENGYVYISASSTANSGKGVCGVLSEPCYPTA